MMENETAETEGTERVEMMPNRVANRVLEIHAEPLMSALSREFVIADLASRLAPDVLMLRVKHHAESGQWAAQVFDYADELYAEGVKRGIYEPKQE